MLGIFAECLLIASRLPATDPLLTDEMRRADEDYLRERRASRHANRAR